MATLKFTTIIPIAVYCFILAAYFLFLGTVIIVTDRAVLHGHDPLEWLPVVVCATFAGGLIAVGVGLLRGSNMCWKILFFILAICLSSVASLILIILGFLVFGINIIGPYISGQFNIGIWVSFLAAFLSEMIVFYYLTRPEMIISFGGLGELNPF